MTQVEAFASGFKGKDLPGVVWTGRSGRRYAMTRVEGTRAVLAPALLYVLAQGGVIRWAGTAEDLIGDQDSRARFRAASANGAQMLSLDVPADPLAIMTLVWDLEGSSQYKGLSAA